MELSELLKQNQSNFLSEELLRHCPDGLMFTQTQPIPLRQIRQIYHLRARRNANMGEPIQGFPGLIAGLDAFTSDTVVIYSIDFEEGSYKVFADAEMKEFAGVLKFPKTPLAKTNLALSDLQTV